MRAIHLILVGFVAAGAGPRANNNTAAEIERGKKLFQDGDFAGALQAFDGAAKGDAKDPRPLYLRGVVLEKEKDIIGAEKAYRDAIARDGRFAPARNNLGAILLGRNDLPAAEKELVAASSSDPMNASVAFNLGLLREAMKQPREAAAEYRHSLRIKPDDGACHANLCSVLRKLGDVDSAITECRQAVRFLPDSATALTNLGLLLYDEKQFDEALVALQSATRLDANSTMAWAALGRVELRRKQTIAAVDALLKAANLAPRDASIAADYCRALAETDLRGNATEEQCRKASTLDAQNALAHYELAKVLVGRGDCGGAKVEQAKLAALPNVGAQAKAQADEIVKACSGQSTSMSAAHPIPVASQSEKAARTTSSQFQGSPQAASLSPRRAPAAAASAGSAAAVAGIEAIPAGVGEPVRGHWQILLDRKSPWKKRLQSVEALGELATGAAVMALLVAVRDPEPTVREAAVQQLKGMQEPFAQAFPDLARSKRAATRGAAIEVAGALKLRSSTAQVVAALSDPEAIVRRAAIVAIVELEGPSGHQRLITALADDDAEVACLAAGMLGRIKVEGAREALLKKLTESSSMDFRPSKWAVTADTDMVSVPEPGGHSYGCDPGASAALALARLGDETVGSIRTVLRSGGTNARRRMVLVLSLNNQIAVMAGVAKMLLSALDDRDAWIRAVAAQTLGELREKAARAKLKTLAAHDPDPQVAKNARQALSTLGE